jgi:hypothetical protein
VHDFRSAAVSLKTKKSTIVNLKAPLAAASAANPTSASDIPEIILKAANEMPSDSSEFDRGIAAGLALAEYLRKTAANQFKK